MIIKNLGSFVSEEFVFLNNQEHNKKKHKAQKIILLKHKICADYTELHIMA